ncbi:MAG: B12-binding domain-containing radical SAM protein [Oligoflexia bacterium]|nr:B12-binding domain-containing radical SAM protein [Oligoflexia bacterium]
MNNQIILAIPIPEDQGLRPSFYPPHIGLAYMAAILIKNGYQVKIFDGLKHPSYSSLKEILHSFIPSYVGISAYTRDIKSANHMAQFIKNMQPNCKIIVGGPHATMLPKQTFLEFPLFDFIVSGEGEFSILNIVKNHDLSTKDKECNRNTDNSIFYQEQTFVDLDLLPMPAWDLFELKHYKVLPYTNQQPLMGDREFAVQISRGCKHACSFCAHGHGKVVRLRSVNNIINEIEFLIEKYNAKSALFMADTFTSNRDYVIDLCQNLIKQKINSKFTWHCCTRVDKLDLELIKIMKEAGLVGINLGVESGDADVLKSVNKNFSFDHLKEIITLFKELNINTTANFIIGLPSENINSIKKTIYLPIKLQIDFATFTKFIPYPGTKLTAELEAKNKILTKDWNKYDTQRFGLLFKHDNFSAVTISILHLIAYAYFYIRPSKIHKFLLQLDSRFIFIALINLIKFFIYNLFSKKEN